MPSVGKNVFLRPVADLLFLYLSEYKQYFSHVVAEGEGVPLGLPLVSQAGNLSIKAVRTHYRSQSG